MKRGEDRLREEVVKTALTMSEKGLSPGLTGNVSAHWRDGMLITPSAVAYDEITPESIVYVEKSGNVPRGQGKPSTEAPMHLAAYEARPEAGAVVHCHSMAATALACARQNIPAIHYLVAAAGGKEIPLAAYATVASAELAEVAARALAGHKACLLANHGQIAVGPDLERALDLAETVEVLARLCLDARILGEWHIIDDAEMDKVLAKFEHYGKR